MTAAGSDDRVPGWGAVSAVAAPVLLIGGWTVAAGLQRGGFDATTGTISALAARGADHRWVMTLALAGVGVAHVTTAAALRTAAPAGRALLALGGVGTAAVAVFALPEEGGSVPHTAAAAVAFASLATWPAFASTLTQDQSPPRASGSGRDAIAPARASRHRRAGLAAAAVLLAELGWFTAELVGDGPRVGLAERVAAGSQAVWPLVAVLLARRR